MLTSNDTQGVNETYPSFSNGTPISISFFEKVTLLKSSYRMTVILFCYLVINTLLLLCLEKLEVLH